MSHINLKKVYRHRMNRSYLNDSLAGFEAGIPFAPVAAELAVDPAAAVVVVAVVVAVVVQSLPVADLAERIRLAAVRSFGFAALAAEHPASGLAVVQIHHPVVALLLVDHQASSCR